MADVLRVPVLRLDPDLPLPAYARPGDAGADLVAREGAVLAAAAGGRWCPPASRSPSPRATPGFVQPRSGLALRHGVTCLNTPGLIDAGYRDELRVLLVNTDPEADYEVRRGDRIAQLVVQRVERADFATVESSTTPSGDPAASATRGSDWRSFVSDSDTNERQCQSSSASSVSGRRLTSWTRRPPSLTRHSSTLASRTAAATPGTWAPTPDPAGRPAGGRHAPRSSRRRTRP